MRINGGRKRFYAALRRRLPPLRGKLPADVIEFFNFDGDVRINGSG